MNAQTQQPLSDEPAPLFKSFEWVPERLQVNTGRYTMLSNIRDLACGVGLVLAMVERQQFAAQNGSAPVVDAADATRLTRMSIAAMSVIEGFIDDHPTKDAATWAAIVRAAIQVCTEARESH